MSKENPAHIIQALNEAEVAERSGNVEMARAAAKRLAAAGYMPESEPAESSAAAKTAAPKGRTIRPKSVG